MKPICYLNAAKGNARKMLEAFAAGSGAEITTKLELRPDREAVFWGVDEATLPLWEEVGRRAHPFIYIDNGYFLGKANGGDYYRITRGAEQHTGEGDSDGARWRRLELRIAPWRAEGRHILVACESDWWHARHGSGSADEFARAVRTMLGQMTARQIVTRKKPIHGHKEPPLAEQFRDCWAVVTHTSMVAAEALLAGVPAFALGRSAMSTVALGYLARIERPHYPEDRERWAGVLADNQWTLREIREGKAWRDLKVR